MKRYINPQSNYSLGSENFYEDSLPVIEFGESLADTSHFVPVTDLTSVSSNVTNTSLFDFPLFLFTEATKHKLIRFVQ